MSTPLPFRRPRGLSEIVAFYGDPWKFMGDDGAMSPAELASWQHEIGLTRLVLPKPLPLSYGHGVVNGKQIKAISVHARAVDAFDAALRELYVGRMWQRLRSCGGAFCFRPKSGDRSELSVHSWGIAIDLDPDTNQLGTEGDIDPGVVAVLKGHGFFWGGDFSGRKDPMHFQLAEGY